MAAQKKKAVKKPAKKTVKAASAQDPEVQKLREELFEAKEKLKEKEEAAQEEKPVESSESTEKEAESKLNADTPQASVASSSIAQNIVETAGETDVKPVEPVKQEPQEVKTESPESDVTEVEVKPEEKTEESPENTEKSSKKSLLILGIIFLFVGAIIGVFIFSSMQYFSNVKDEKKAEAVPTVVPTATSTPQISYGTYALEVLNGSGISGQAAETANVLEAELGFNSDNTSVGNAPDTVEETTVELKPQIPQQVFDDIKTTLPEFTVVLGDPLSEDDENDVVITLGTKQE